MGPSAEESQRRWWSREFEEFGNAVLVACLTKGCQLCATSAYRSDQSAL